MSAMEILVIILSIFLAVFLLSGIILVLLLIKATRQIRRVTASAERTANNFESVSANISKVSSPIFIGKLIAKQFKKRSK